ncbi:hypothetical protein [Rhizocola hellebori]|uniref:hypothetical protein n=1 Tax=Rhizocola hellebori TaxID=1392758 RepID=UPI0019433070|nr:hypothetical protein [Rhizocola hellebori]
MPTDDNDDNQPIGLDDAPAKPVPKPELWRPLFFDLDHRAYVLRFYRESIEDAPEEFG